MIKNIKFKQIKDMGLPFLSRVSLYTQNGSVKIHFMVNDDKSEPHTHPWDFKSFLIIPYMENLDGEKHRHRPFKLLNRKMNQRHRITLYRFMGIKIPALTVGFYSKKKQLCSFCKDLGYCKSEGSAK